MMTIKSIAFILTSLIMPLAQAAEVKINWLNPDTYSDIRADSSGSKSAYEKRLFSILDDEITQQARQLPTGQTLSMNFTNIKLAGKVLPVRDGETRRIVRDSDLPAKLDFNYQLTDASGSIIQQGNEQLKSTMTTARSTKSGAYALETKMLERWFKRTF